MIDRIEQQKPFEIDVTLLTSEMLGRFILGKLETSKAFIVPIYDTQPVAGLENCLLTEEEIRERV